MFILALDNALDTLTIALANENGILHEKTQTIEAPSAVIAREVGVLLAQSECLVKDVNAIFVTVGPGSFTGIRVALSFCKGIRAAHHVPLIGIPTLDALSAPLAATREGHYLCPLIDAKKGELFTTLYRVSNNKLNRLTEYQTIKPDSISQFVNKPCLFFGNGITHVKPHIKSTDGFFIEETGYQTITADSLITIGLDIMGNATPPNTQPIYGRRSEAEIKFQVVID